MTGYKTCPWPSCGGRCAERWMFCSRCQGSRVGAMLTGLVNGRPITDVERGLLQAKTEHRRANERKWRTSPQARAYRSAWKHTPPGRDAVARERRRVADIRRSVAAERERVRWRSREYREEAMRLAKEAASAELLQLIEEQERDNNRVRRATSDPWMLRSLDEPIPGMEGKVLADMFGSGGYWSDPTADMAIALVEGW